MFARKSLPGQLLAFSLQLQGTTQDGSQQYKLNCKLASFQTSTNAFCTALGPYVLEPDQFAEELAKSSNVVVAASNRGVKRVNGTHTYMYVSLTIN